MFTPLRLFSLFARITEFTKGCCSDPVSTVSYETVYLPHVVGMSMGRSKLLVQHQSFGLFDLCFRHDEESKPCCCDPNQTAADWLHIYTTSSDLQIRAYLPISVFPTIRVAVASAKAPTAQHMQ